MIDNPLFISFLLIPFLAAPLIYLLGRLAVRKGQMLGMQAARLLTLAALLAEIVILVLIVKSAMGGGSVQWLVGLEVMRFDGIGLVLAALVLVLGVCVTIFSFSYMNKEKGEEKFYALLMLTIGSIIGLGFSYDLFNLWIWFEAMAISTYFLVAFYNEQSASLEAGVKYLVQSAVGSALVLFGIAAIFAALGSVSLEDIWQYGGQLGALGALGLVLMIVGFGVKAALVPMHTWLPDAHSQAPSGISAMLSGVVIEAGLVAMLRVISMTGKLGGNWGYILIIFACLNILVGNLMALRQTEVKRMLAYSSLAHMGYMLFGFGLGFAFGSNVGAEGGFFHMLTHGLMKGLAFLSVGALLFALKLVKGDHSSLTLADLNGASRKYPLIAVGLSVAVLALGGLPPFAGFMSKWMILVAGVQTQNTWMLIAVIFVGLNSVLSLGYYAPIVNCLFKREQSEVVAAAEARMPWAMSLPIVILSLAVILIGVWPMLTNFLTFNGQYFLMGYFFN
jgi:proton-translocating NADH-quinone oxidoreductase chain N